jgi:hypothetical protein
MPWLLVRTLLVCSGRRLLPFVRRNPLLAVIAAGGFVALPPLGLALGNDIGPALGAAVGADRAVAEALVLGAVVSGAFAGTTIATLAPGTAVLGEQLQVAPLERGTSFAAFTALPLLALTGVLVALSAPFLLALALHLPSGVGGAGLLVLTSLTAAVTAAAASVAGPALFAGQALAGAAVFAVVGAVWLAGATAGGSVLGPFALVVTPLRDPGVNVLWAAAACLGVGSAAAAGWVTASGPAVRATARARRPRPLVPFPQTPWPALAVAALRRYGRRRELRRHAAVVVTVSATAAAAITTALPAPPALTVVLVGGAAVFGAAIVPLAAHGLDREAEWLWRAAPQPRAAVAVAGSGAALVLGTLLLATATVPAGLMLGAPPASYVLVGAAAVVAFAAALAGGCAVPWRSDRIVDQLAGFGALAVLTPALWVALGRVVRAAATAGVAVGVAWALVGALAVASSIAVTAVAATRRCA